MNLYKKITLIFCASFLTLIMTFMAYAADAREPLIFAGDRDYPPFESIKDGQPVGINVDILRALSKVMHRDIEIRLMKWSEAQQMIIEDKADALTEMAYTKSRAELFDFSEQTVLYKYSFFVKKDDEIIHQITEAEGKTIAVTKGGYPRQFLKSNKKIKFYTMKNNLDGFKHLLAGDVDAVATDYWVGAYTLQENNLTRVIKFDIRSFAEKPGFIPVKKGNTALLNEINQGITKLRKEGTIQEIFERWSGKSIVFMTKEKLKKLTSIVVLALALLIIFFTVFWVYVLNKQLKSKTAELQKAHNNLEAKVQEKTISLQHEIADHRKAEEALQAAHNNLENKVIERTALLNAINKVFRKSLTCASEEELGKTCLSVAEELTGSKFGLIGEVNAQGLFDTIAISNPGWDVCKMAEINSRKEIKNMPIRGIDRATIRDGESRIVSEDEMAIHPDRVGIPDGHPRITAFLGVPLKYKNKTIGMIGLGNKEGGYSTADQETVETLSVAIEESLRNKRAEIELLHIREELIRKEKLAVLGQLAGGVGHELRNPLGVISNAVYFLKTVQEDADDTVKEYLETISSEVKRSTKIVSDLMDLTRSKIASKERVGISELISLAVERSKISESVTVGINIPEGLPPLNIDPGQIEQVIENLITNANQSMPDGGDLLIEVKKEESFVEISITDTGIGIAPDKLDKIFEPLFTTRARGIGLGLSVSRTLAEKNSGTITVISEEGKGSTFTVTLAVETE
jgi:signal transduction histidine kinase/ABC-type amino acid transport substrate-binding protein